MKFLQVLGLSVGLGFSMSLWSSSGPPEDIFVVLKGNDYFQDGPSSVVVNPFFPTPFFFESFAGESGSLDAILSVSFLAPLGSTYVPSPVELVFDSEDQFWSTGEIGYTSEALRDSNFNDGTYSFTIDLDDGGLPFGASLNLAADGNSERFFSAIPEIVSLTNAFWEGGALVMSTDLTATFGLNTGALSNFEDGVDFVILNIWGPDGFGEEIFSSSLFSEFTIGMDGDFWMGPGMYSAELSYVNVVDINSGDIPGLMGLAGFVSITSFNIHVIPEPSTWALILGGIAFTGVVIIRRRTQRETVG